jgi:hypothetical protein
MSVSQRERMFMRRLTKASDRFVRHSPDLFEAAEAKERRRVRLFFVVRRLAAKLGLPIAADIESLDHEALERIRVSLTKEAVRRGAVA